MTGKHIKACSSVHGAAGLLSLIGLFVFFKPSVFLISPPSLHHLSPSAEFLNYRQVCHVTPNQLSHHTLSRDRLCSTKKAPVSEANLATWRVGVIDRSILLSWRSLGRVVI